MSFLQDEISEILTSLKNSLSYLNKKIGIGDFPIPNFFVLKVYLILKYFKYPFSKIKNYVLAATMLEIGFSIHDSFANSLELLYGDYISSFFSSFLRSEDFHLSYNLNTASLKITELKIFLNHKVFSLTQRLPLQIKLCCQIPFSFLNLPKIPLEEKFKWKVLIFRISKIEVFCLQKISLPKDFFAKTINYAGFLKSEGIYDIFVEALLNEFKLAKEELYVLPE